MGLNITPADIDTITEIGLLDGSPVKLVRTKGGFHMCFGKPRGQFKEAVLSAGSHPAIAKYVLEKQYPGFQPAMMKSEDLSDPTIVDKHSHFLSEDLRKSGHDIFSIQKGDGITFSITKHNLQIAKAEGSLIDGSLVVNSLGISKELSRALAGATVEKATSCGAKNIKVGAAK